MTINKRMIILASIVVVIILGLLFIYTSTRGYELNIRFSDQETKQTVKIYKADDTNPVKELTGPNYKTNLPKDEYTVVVEEGEKYKEFAKTFKLESSSTIDVGLIYKREYFDNILKPQEEVIKGVIRKSVSIPPGYEINNGSLLKDENWYGTTISVKNPSQLTIDATKADTYRVILQKTNGEWKLITVPPEISISSIKYPKVPKDIIKLANLVPVEINDQEQTRWQQEW
jgi:hypothetical protein